MEAIWWASGGGQLLPTAISQTSAEPNALPRHAVKVDYDGDGIRTYTRLNGLEPLPI